MPEIWNADIYLRLSKEDGDKAADGKIDSDSITNQRKLALDFIEGKADIEVHRIRIDDGYTGSNFDRPAFQDMLDDIRTGIVNCVIVKDLSRFGRDYIEAGDYIEKIFPALGVRFISINDNIDSIRKATVNDAIIVPFKNLINDFYCGDISAKVRSMFDLKRRNGDFIGSFAAYGYRKNPENKNKLLIDEPAAAIVKEIYRLRIAGMSSDAIAKMLNEMGVRSPMEYKKANGIPFYTSFCAGETAHWTPSAVTGILKNEIYIGTLIQGKDGTPSHKVKTRLKKPCEEWFVVEKNHAAIISKPDFEMVQKVLGLDTRTSPNGKAVYLLSGLVICGGCGANMVRKNVPSGKNKYAYFVCNTRKKGGACANHSISVKKVEHTVLTVLRAQIAGLADLTKVVHTNSEESFLAKKCRNINVLFEEKQTQITEYQHFKRALYESLVKGILSKEDYHTYYFEYDQRISELQSQCERLKQEAGRYVKEKNDQEKWLQSVRICKGTMECDRGVIIRLIEKIVIQESGEMKIIFDFQDEYQMTV